jgi:Ribbon-helix-helix protein, copG family
VGRSGLDRLFARLGEPVRVSATVSFSTAVRLDVLARARGVSRSAAIAEAVEVRTLVWEQQALRRQKVQIARVFREAEEWAPLDELLASVRAGDR